MAMDAHVDAFNITTGAATSTVAVTGLGFQPKAIVFWWSGRTETTDSVGRADHQRGSGFAVSSSDRRCTTVRSRDNIATSETARMQRNDACIASITPGADTVDGLADLQSMDSDGFTLIIDNQFSVSLRIHYLALGGASLTNAITGQFNSTSGTPPYDQDITGLGFQPEFLMVATIFTSIENAVDVHCNQSFGMATGSVNEVAFQARTQDDRPTGESSGYGNSDDTAVQASSGTGALSRRAEFKQFISGGFRITWVEHSGGELTQPFYYLALKGGDYSVGDLLTRTDSNDIAVTGLGFKPSAVLFLSACRAEDTRDTPTDHDEISIGAASSTSDRGAQAALDVNGVSTMEVTTAVEHDAVYVNLASGSVTGLMDMKSFDSGGFTCVMDDTDPSASFVSYAAFGPRAADADSAILANRRPNPLLRM